MTVCQQVPVPGLYSPYQVGDKEHQLRSQYLLGSIQTFLPLLVLGSQPGVEMGARIYDSLCAQGQNGGHSPSIYRQGPCTLVEWGTSSRLKGSYAGMIATGSLGMGTIGDLHSPGAGDSREGFLKLAPELVKKQGQGPG